MGTFMSVDIADSFAYVPKISNLLFSFLNNIQISFWHPSLWKGNSTHTVHSVFLPIVVASIVGM